MPIYKNIHNQKKIPALINIRLYSNPYKFVVYDIRVLLQDKCLAPVTYTYI